VRLIAPVSKAQDAPSRRVQQQPLVAKMFTLPLHEPLIYLDCSDNIRPTYSSQSLKTRDLAMVIAVLAKIQGNGTAGDDPTSGERIPMESSTLRSTSADQSPTFL
jgi:hypothetical protein